MVSTPSGANDRRAEASHVLSAAANARLTGACHSIVSNPAPLDGACHARAGGRGARRSPNARDTPLMISARPITARMAIPRSVIGRTLRQSMAGCDRTLVLVRPLDGTLPCSFSPPWRNTIVQLDVRLPCCHMDATGAARRNGSVAGPGSLSKISVGSARSVSPEGSRSWTYCSSLTACRLPTRR